jgi:secretion/DNA translocation related TadE-like protein
VSSGDRGSITVLLAGAIFSVLVLGIVIAVVGQVLNARFQASTAADAAALAAAPATFNGDPHEEAVRFAAANGARLLSCQCSRNRTWAPRTVETVVEIEVDVLGLGRRSVRAKGRAEYLPLPAGP